MMVVEVLMAFPRRCGRPRSSLPYAAPVPTVAEDMEQSWSTETASGSHCSDS